MHVIFENRKIDTKKPLKLVMLRFRNKFTLVATVAKTQQKYFVKKKLKKIFVWKIIFSQ